jgi:predicted nucleotidyltransferase
LLKAALRRFVLRTSGSLLRAVYLGLYGLMISGAALVLRRYRSVLAIYLCRGCARSEITPAISDVDLTIIITNDSDEKEAIQRAFRTLGKLTGGVIDFYPNLVATQAAMEERWRSAPLWQYRYDEGRTTWKLIHGRDLISEYPPLSAAQFRSSCYTELTRWWIVFAEQMFPPGDRSPDVSLQNATCYKAVAEVMRVDAALRTGTRAGSRQDGLRSAPAALGERLERLVKGRFLPRDEQAVEETLRFLIRYFTDLWAGFCEQPFLQVFPDRPQRLDCPQPEVSVGPAGQAHLDRLRRHVDAHWGAKCQRTRVVKSALWELDDLLWIIDVDRARPPTVREIAELCRLHHDGAGALEQRLFLFLRVGSVAFPLTPVIPRDLHRGLLTPGTAPDVFLQLGEEPVYWTDYTRWYLGEWDSNQQWLEASAQKRLQLELISKSAQNGGIVYPLTPAALEREAQRLRA